MGSQFQEWNLSTISQSHLEIGITWGIYSKGIFPGQATLGISIQWEWPEEQRLGNWQGSSTHQEICGLWGRVWRQPGLLSLQGATHKVLTSLEELFRGVVQVTQSSGGRSWKTGFLGTSLERYLPWCANYASLMAIFPSHYWIHSILITDRHLFGIGNTLDFSAR